MIKLLATITMLIDHIGLIFFPHLLILRSIGRISMPLFAYGIAQGYYRTKEHGTTSRYLFNLSMFAIISQIPYTRMVDGKFNIGFTWLLSVIVLILLESENLPKVCRILMAGIILTASMFIEIDYGMYGILSVAVMYKFAVLRNNMIELYCWGLLLNAMYLIVHPGAVIQFISFLAVVIIASLKPIDQKIRLPKWFNYSFYPAHIAILTAIKSLL